MLIGKAQSLANAGIETPPVMTAVELNPVATTFEIMNNCCIFLVNFSLLVISSKNEPSFLFILSAYNFLDLPLVMMVL